MAEKSGSGHSTIRTLDDVGKITWNCCKFCYVHNDLLLIFLNFKLSNEDASKYLCSYFDKDFYANDKEHEISLDDLIQNTENKNMLFSDNKFMIVRLFHGKRPLSRQDDNKFTFYGSRKFNNSDSTKISYKRLFYAYDHCDKKTPIFMMIFTKNPIQEMQGVWNMTRKNPCLIGLDVVIREPQFKLRWSIDGIPVLDLEDKENALIPVADETTIDDPPERPIQSTSQGLEMDVSSMQVFRYHNAIIDIGHIEFKSSCAGTLCDRVETDKTECLCIQKASGSTIGMTIEMTVEFKTLPTNNPPHSSSVQSETFYEHKFRSCRFFMLFLSPEHNKEVIIDHLQEIKTHIKAKVKEVNASPGKWFIEGWYKPGLKATDVGSPVGTAKPSYGGGTTGASKGDTDKNKMISADIKPHITSLKPVDAAFLTSMQWIYSSRRSPEVHAARPASPPESTPLSPES